MTPEEIRAYARDCATHPGYPQGALNVGALHGVGDGCGECLAALVEFLQKGRPCLQCQRLGGELMLARRELELQKEYEAKLQAMYDGMVKRCHDAYDRCNALLDRLEKVEGG